MRLKMKRNGTFLKFFPVMPYYLLILLPLAGFIGPVESWKDAAMDARRWGLFWNSMRLSLLSAFCCAGIGLLAALKIRNGRLRCSRLRWFFLLLSPVPFYIYALTWMYMARAAGRIGLWKISAAGLIPCAAVNTLAFLPITTGLMLAAMERMDGAGEEMASMYAGGGRVFFRILLPRLLPLCAASAGIVFVLTAADFSVPSLFQYNTFTLEIFSEYSAGGNLTEIGLLSLPIILPAALALALVQRELKMIPSKSRRVYRVPLKFGGGLEIAGGLAVFACLFQTIAPTLTFLTQIGDWGELVESLLLCREELAASLGMSAAAALLSCIVSGPAAAALAGKKSFLLWTAALLPMTVPSALIAMGLVAALNGSIVHGLTLTALFPALGCAVKYMPFALLILVAGIRRLDLAGLELGRLYAGSGGRYLFRILLPVMGPWVFCAMAVVFLLSLGEESIGLILMPPGYEMLAVKIYNYLHYGASELVSGFCLVTVVITAGVFSAVMWIASGRKGRGNKHDTA